MGTLITLSGAFSVWQLIAAGTALGAAAGGAGVAYYKSKKTSTSTPTTAETLSTTSSAVDPKLASAVIEALKANTTPKA